MPRTIPRPPLLPLLTALALGHAPLVGAEDATPSGQHDAPPVTEAPGAAPAEPDPAQVEAWLAAGRALKAERPELFGGAEGVLVTEVLPDGQGATAGITSGDVLIADGDTPLDSAQQLAALTGETPAVTALTLRWLRPDADGGVRVLEAGIRGGRIGVGIRDLADTPAARMQALNDAGVAARNRGGYEEALELFRQGLAVATDTRHEPMRGHFLRSIGDTFDELGRYAEALEKHNEALSIAREAADPRVEAAVHNSLGIVYTRIGRYDLAVEHYERRLIIARDLSDRRGEGTTLNNMAVVYRNLGRYHEALDLLFRALSIHREVGDMRAEGKTISAIGHVYSELGRYEDAMEQYAQAIEIHIKTGDRLAEVNDYGNLGVAYHNRGLFAKALGQYKQALAIEREIGNRGGEAKSLANIGALYADLGRYEDALKHLNAALAIEREIGDQGGEARVLLNLGAVEQDQGEPNAAIDYYREALALQTNLKEPETLWRLWHNLRQLWEDTELPGPAILAGKRAVNTVQAMRAMNSSLDQAHQRSFLQDKEHVYRHLADLLITQGRIPEAEQVLAMLKEQELYDFIRRRAAQDDPRTTRADWAPAEAAWNARYDAVADDLAALGLEYRQLAKLAMPDDAEQQRLAELEKRLDAGGDALIAIVRALEEEFAAQGGAAAVAFGAQQLDWLRGQQAMLVRLGHGAVLISTIVTEDRLHLILTTPDTQVARQSRIDRAELNRLIVAFRQALTNRHADLETDLLPLAQQLHGVLVAPIAADLAQARAGTLMWSLDAGLRYVPLAALHDGARWLIEQHPLALYTLAARENLREDLDGAWRVAGLGVSRAHPGFSALDAVPAELDGIIIRAPGDPNGVIAGELHLDDDFDEPRLKAMLRAGYPVLHIASHFKLNPGDNSASFLLLGDGSRLALADFEAKTAYRLDHIDQLTLSACDTAMGNPERSGSGAEVESFGALAQKRGAKGVLATLWPVADASTGVLMQTLYRARGADPTLTKADALRQAQLSLLQGTGAADGAAAATAAGGCASARRPLDLAGGDPAAADARATGPAAPGDTACGWGHPYHWAPFVLMGNWL
jgi:CHAT domain-containing protein/tetratricopeptide (TPR) repeat protein